MKRATSLLAFGKLSAGSWLWLGLGLLLLSSTSLSAQVTVAPTLPNVSTFLYGNTSVNAIGKTTFVSGTGYGYRYLTPKTIVAGTKYPAIIFLCGEGEAGTNNTAQLAAANNTGNGVLALVSTANPNNQANYPCFFICPQVAAGVSWSSDAAATQIQKLLTIFETQYPNSFDTSRIYLTGLSDGGTGSYDLPFFMSESTHMGTNPFAATVPMSGQLGWGNRANSTEPFMPIWAFHAANDTTVTIASSDDLTVPALRALGFPVVYSRYLTGGHPIWQLAYQHPQLLPWLFAQTLSQTTQAPLSNFAITGESMPSSSLINLSGTTSTAEAYTGIAWSDPATGQSGNAVGSMTPTWSISNIPLATGANDLQITASAANNTALVSGVNTNYGGTLTVNAPYTASPSTITNVALNKPVTVSSTDGNPGSGAVDGNTNTRWSSAYSDPQWITIDLGANYDIDEIDLNWQTACGYNYLIQTSTDDFTWTTRTSVYGNTSSGLLAYPYSTPPSARYVRVYGTQRATPWGYSLWEIAVYSSGLTVTSPTAPTGPVSTTPSNVALNKPVTASSTDYPGDAASNAVDGDVTTRWSSAYSDPQWISVDLGSNYDIDEVDLNWEAACGSNYLIQTSLDDLNWTTQTTVAGNSTSGLLQYAYSNPITCRYVRMYGTQRATQWGYSLWEFAVIGVPSTSTTTPQSTGPTNLALNQPVTTSSTDYPGDAGANAVDGNTNTRWSSAYSDSQWIVVDLGASHSISEIDLNWEAACGYNYLIQTSTDNVNWTTQNTVVANTTSGVIPYAYVNPVTARYVRMYGTQRATQWGYSLWEIAVYGQ